MKKTAAYLTGVLVVVLVLVEYSLAFTKLVSKIAMLEKTKECRLY
ncbi:hypothetical protein ABG808_08095 [Streptococcus iniae]